jgi:hypothetical protein
MLLKGKSAKLILQFLLTNFEGPLYNAFPVSGYFKEDNHYICFDNLGYSCFIEQAKTKKSAKDWCLRKIETSKLYFKY